MIHGDLVTLILSAGIDIFISLMVLYRNYRKPANISFALTSFGLVCWAILNYLSAMVGPSFTLIITRLTGLFGALLIASFFTLSLVFPNTLRINKKQKNILLVLTLVICSLCLTGLFIKSGTKTSSGLALTEGALYPLYALYAFTMFVLCNINFVRQYRHAKILAKNQIKLMWLGIVSTVVLIILSNIVIPAVTQNWSSSKFGTIFIFPFVAITAYAILRKHMFDVRLIITRTIAYILTIGVVATLYSFIIILIASHLVSFGELKSAQVIALVIPALFIALTFHRIQLFIDRATQRIFYRDAYDLRDVLDRLSDALLTENDIAIMMQQSLDILTDALKPTAAYFAVLNSSGRVYKQIQAGVQNNTDITPFLVHINKESGEVIDSDDAINPTLAKLMSSHNIELALRLGDKKTPTGLLLLSNKRNGSPYTGQDISLLEISAKNLGIALDNAKRYEQILHFADTMHKEVKRATSRLRKANEELKTLDALKDDFIATASHQLRTPSASVHDALRMLNEPKITPADRDELLLLAEASSERLVSVVRTMLNMARIQAGHFTIDTSETEMTELVENIIAQVKVLANEKNITIDFEKSAKPIHMLVDVAKINEATTNYIENAIKYSPDKSTLTIRLNEAEGKVFFEVIDQGMGVPASERENLFGRFYRATNARQEQPDGNGIGLYVVRTIAEGHGGEAYYKPGVERGSVFGFWLPAQQPK